MRIARPGGPTGFLRRFSALLRFLGVPTPRASDSIAGGCAPESPVPVRPMRGRGEGDRLKPDRGRNGRQTSRGSPPDWRLRRPSGPRTTHHDQDSGVVMSNSGHGPELSDEELGLLEDRFATTCIDAVVLGVLTPAEVSAIQERLRQKRRQSRVISTPGLTMTNPVNPPGPETETNVEMGRALLEDLETLTRCIRHLIAICMLIDGQLSAPPTSASSMATPADRVAERQVSTS